MSNAALSFDIDNFTHRDKEARRLALQASLLPSRPLWEKAGLVDGMTVVDLGCGPSTHTLELATQTPSGKIIGIDASEFLITEARRQVEASGRSNIDLICSDAARLPLADGSVDFVWARLLVQHLREPQCAIEEAHRVLRPGGRICLVDTDRETFFIHPYPRGRSDLVKFIVARQAVNGGDGTAGRKLGSRLYQAGFVDINVELHGTSWTGAQLLNVMNDMWIPAMQHSPYPEEMRPWVEALFAEMAAIAEQPGAYMHWGWFVATGRKP